MESNSRTRDIFSKDIRDRPEEDEQETEIRIRHHVRLFPTAKVRRRRKRRLPRRYVNDLRHCCRLTNMTIIQNDVLFARYKDSLRRQRTTQQTDQGLGLEQTSGSDVRVGRKRVARLSAHFSIIRMSCLQCR